MSDADRIPCPVCGEMIVATAQVCRFCGEQIGTSKPRRKEAAGDPTGGLIPYKNMPALIAYYCGVFSILSIFPCFFPIGIAGVVLGIRGLRKAKREPQVRGQVHAWIGIVAGGIFGLIGLIVTAATVMAVIGGAMSR